MKGSSGHRLASLRRHAPLAATCLVGVFSLGWLFWLVRDQPFEPDLLAGYVRLDGLSAWFVALIALATLLHYDRTAPWRSWLVASALLLAVVLTPWPGIVAALGLAVLATYLPPVSAALRWRRFALPAAFMALTSLALAAASIIRTTGAWTYTDPAAGLGLNSLAFALTLFAALQCLPDELVPASRPYMPLILRLAWFYPLLRLYSLGPWNTGWLLATLLLGAGLAATAAWRALTAPTGAWRGAHMAGFGLGLALASAGLGSAAGLAAAAYAMLAALLLDAALATPPADPGRQAEALLALLLEAAPADSIGLPAPWLQRYLPWLLAPVLPFATPFVATWMAMAAAAASGLPALAMTLWGAGLLAGLAFLRGFVRGEWPPSRRLQWLAFASLALGSGAPLLVLAGLQPLVEQLAGGLSPLGDLAVWPWAGILALDAGARAWAAFPSLALIAVLLINAALVWLAWRYLNTVRER